MGEEVTTQAMYVHRNIEACFCNSCCSGKAVITCITYPECVFLVLCIQYTRRMRRIKLISSLWPVRLYNILPHHLINGTIFGKKRKVIENIFFSRSFVWRISYSKKSWANYDQKYALVFM